MKRIFTDKGISRLETGIIAIMAALGGELVFSTVRADLQLIANKDVFTFAATLLCLSLLIAIAFSIRLNHRVYEQWHVAYMFLLLLNYLCMYSQAWVIIHKGVPSAEKLCRFQIFFQIICVILMHICYDFFVGALTDHKKMFKQVIITGIISLFAFALYVFCVMKPNITNSRIMSDSGTFPATAAFYCVSILIITAIPALVSSIPRNWKLSVIYYPANFLLAALGYLWNSDYLFLFQALALSCMCTYGLMYTDNEEQKSLRTKKKAPDGDLSEDGMQTKNVSIMKVSLREFSYIADYLNESITIDITNTFLKEMMETVAFFGGKVTAFPACSFIAVFGTEKNNSGYRARAVGAALEIINKMGDFNAWCVKKDYPRVYASTTVVTCPMLIGYAGYDEYRRFTIIGEGTELCDQLEKYCGENEILVSESTMENYNDQIHMQKRGTINRKDGSPMSYFKISKGNQQI